MCIFYGNSLKYKVFPRQYFDVSMYKKNTGVVEPNMFNILNLLKYMQVLF